MVFRISGGRSTDLWPAVGLATRLSDMISSSLDPVDTYLVVDGVGITATCRHDEACLTNKVGGCEVLLTGPGLVCFLLVRQTVE